MIRYFAGHPTAANLLMIVIIVLGLTAVPDLRRATFPDYRLGKVGIEIEYPGASAEEVERSVCQRIADALEGLAELAELRCEVREGFANAVAELHEGGNFGRFINDVKTRIDAIEDLPSEVARPRIEELERTDFVAEVVLSGPMSVAHLKVYAEDLRRRLLHLPEVSQVILKGFSDHQLRVEVSHETLQQLGLSIEDIASRIARQGIDLPIGSIEGRTREVLIRFEDERRSPEELAGLVVVSAASGAEIRLGQIATISDRFEDDHRKVVFAGERAAALEIRKTATEDSFRVIEAVREELEKAQTGSPPTVQLAISQDVSDIVRDRLDMLIGNGVTGLILVFLTLWLFFPGRFAFWVVAGLPVSFLGTLFLMVQIGYSINMVTMVGLLMAIGLLMDDAIVLSENIAARMEQGGDAIEAVTLGVTQVAPGVLSSLVTTLVVFGPMAFLSGDIGRVLKALPVVLIFALLVSLIEAFLILPHHLARPLLDSAGVRPAGFRRRFEQGFHWTRDQMLGRAVAFTVCWRYPFLGFLLFGGLASMGLVQAGMVRFQALPEIEGNVIVARLLMPQGTPLQYTEEITQRILDALHRVDEELAPRNPHGQRLVRHVQIRYGENRNASEYGPHVATLVVDLLAAEQRRVRLAELYDRWREAIGPIPNLVSLNLQEPDFGPQGRPIKIRLQGAKLDVLKAASLELQAQLRSYVGTRDVIDDLRPGKPERRLRLRDGASSLGLDATAIAQQLRVALLGQTAREIQVGAEDYEIEVRQPLGDRDSLADLDNFRVTLPGGGQVPLDVVASVEATRGWARINNIDGRRTLTVQGDVDTRIANTIEIIGELRRDFIPMLKRRYPGLEVQIAGQSYEAAETGQSISRSFVLGLLGIFLVLAFQFRSYSEPLVVMAIIPFALLGALWGHMLLGFDLSMASLVGAVSLAGVVVNDSILLVQFVKLRAAEGHAVPLAAQLASRDRFRAVLLTSLTTILGLLPLLAETSLQALVLKPLIVSVVFGLLASTLLVLLVVPVLFSIQNDLTNLLLRR
jgi:HAE1 family hydrophobic/amphiphilic exporter-1